MPGRIKVSVAPSREPPGLEMEESFEYGSFDENEKDGALAKQKTGSFRLNIRKVINKGAQNVSKVKFDRIRSVPLTKREKMDGPTNVDLNAQITRVIATNHDGKVTDRRAVMRKGDGLYSNSWRAKNSSAPSIRMGTDTIEENDDTVDDLEIPENPSSRDDESESGPGYINSFVSALGFGSSRDGHKPRPNLELKTSVLSTQTESVEVRLSESEVRKLYDSSVKAINDDEWYVVLNNIIYCKTVVGLQPEDCDKKNLFHLIASKKIVPHKVFNVMTEADPEAHKQMDSYGCVPLHYAASVGRNVNTVKYLLRKWPFGASARNVDGDLPLHVAVWCGGG